MNLFGALLLLLVTSLQCVHSQQDPLPTAGGPPAPHERRPFARRVPGERGDAPGMPPHGKFPRVGKQQPATAPSAFSEAADVLEHMEPAAVAAAPMVTDLLGELHAAVDDNHSAIAAFPESVPSQGGVAQTLEGVDENLVVQQPTSSSDLNTSSSDGSAGMATQLAKEELSQLGAVAGETVENARPALHLANVSVEAISTRTAEDVPTGDANSSEGVTDDRINTELHSGDYSTPDIVANVGTEDDNESELNSSTQLWTEQSQEPEEASFVNEPVDAIAVQEMYQEPHEASGAEPEDDASHARVNLGYLDHDNLAADQSHSTAGAVDHEDDQLGFAMHAPDQLAASPEPDEMQEAEYPDHPSPTHVQPSPVVDIDIAIQQDYARVPFDEFNKDTANASFHENDGIQDARSDAGQPDYHDHENPRHEHGALENALGERAPGSVISDGGLALKQPLKNDGHQADSERLRLPVWESFVHSWMSLPSDEGWHSFKLQTCLELVYLHTIRVILASIRALEEVLLVQTTTYEKLRPHVQTLIDLCAAAGEGIAALIPPQWGGNAQEVVSSLPELLKECACATVVLLFVLGWVRTWLHLCASVCCCACRRKSNSISKSLHPREDGVRVDPMPANLIPANNSADASASGFTEVAKIVKTGKITLQLKQLGQGGTQQSQPSSAATSPQGYPRNSIQPHIGNQPFQVPTLNAHHPPASNDNLTGEQEAAATTTAEHAQPLHQPSHQPPHQPPAAFAASAAFNTRAPRTDSRNRVQKTASSAFNAVTTNVLGAPDSHHPAAGAHNHYTTPPSTEVGRLSGGFELHNGPPSSRSADRYGVNEHSPSGHHPSLFPSQEPSTSGELHGHDTERQHYAASHYAEVSAYAPPPTNSQAQWQGRNPAGFARRPDAY